ncbi:NAD(P)/FAD-dependent oxidoreductase [Myxococcota bacterium]|nr:NAD(P)/FAD-dependent oxidoreductase [Myxococcota bacterium]
MTRESKKRDLRIAIIGAGPGGLCMAIHLRRAGFENFEILEKASGLGGTWYHNRYPGCACDIPSHLYSYSFEVKKDWSRPYAPQPEILQYLEDCADKYDLRRHFRFGSKVEQANWDHTEAKWTLELGTGESLLCDVVVSAIGMFNDLNYPEIEGLETFAGKSFHSAQWDWEYDLRGKQIGVIGSAASAVQFVPEIVKEAGQVHYFQRTANWVLPKEDDPYSPEALEHFRSHPTAAQDQRDEIFNRINSGGPGIFESIRPGMEKAGHQNMAFVEDPEIRAKLVPTHPWGCKRPLFSNDYYRAFNRSNLELVTDGIDRITPSSILTVDGNERPIDTLILATGFKTTRYLSSIDVRGRDGITIGKAWTDGAVAYQGVTTAGFPNLFMLYGPNTNSDSLITMIEYHVEHSMLHIERLAREDIAWIDVRSEIMDDYNDRLQKEIEAIGVWYAGCTDYYRAPSGRVVTQWPHTMGEHREMLAQIDSDAYEVGP